jgi:hypothetical protein
VEVDVYADLARQAHDIGQDEIEHAGECLASLARLEPEQPLDHLLAGFGEQLLRNSHKRMLMEPIVIIMDLLWSLPWLV